MNGVASLVCAIAAAVMAYQQDWFSTALFCTSTVVFAAACRLDRKTEALNRRYERVVSSRNAHETYHRLRR